jgi:hypothetical protein
MRYRDLIAGDTFEFLDGGQQRPLRYAKLDEERMYPVGQPRLVCKVPSNGESLVSHVGPSFDDGDRLELDTAGGFAWKRNGGGASGRPVTVEDVLNAGFANDMPWMVMMPTDPKAPWVQVAWPVERVSGDVLTMFVDRGDRNAVSVRYRTIFTSDLVPDFRRYEYRVVDEPGAPPLRSADYRERALDFFLANEARMARGLTLAIHEAEYVAARRASAEAAHAVASVETFDDVRRMRDEFGNGGSFGTAQWRGLVRFVAREAERRGEAGHVPTDLVESVFALAAKVNPLVECEEPTP